MKARPRTVTEAAGTRSPVLRWLVAAGCVHVAGFATACSTSEDPPSGAAPDSRDDGKTDDSGDDAEKNTEPGGKQKEKGNENRPAPAAASPLDALVPRTIGALRGVIDLQVLGKDVLRASTFYANNGTGCNEMDVSILTANGTSARSIAPKGAWGAGVSADGRWLIVSGAAGHFPGKCPTVTSASIYDLMSPSAPSRSVPTGAFFTHDTVVYPSGSTVKGQSPSTGAPLWTVNATSTRLQNSLDGAVLGVWTASGMLVVDPTTGSIRTQTSSPSARFLTRDGAYLTAASTSDSFDLFDSKGVKTTLAGALEGVSTDSSRLVRSVYSSVTGGATSYVRTLASGAEISFAGTARLSPDGRYIDGDAGWRPITGGNPITIGGQGETVTRWTAEGDRSLVLYQYSVPSSADPRFAMRSGTATVPVVLPGFWSHLEASPDGRAFVVHYTLTASDGTYARRIAFITTRADGPEAPRELWKAPESSDVRAGEVLGWAKGVFYYRANNELRAITADGKHARTFGKAMISKVVRSDPAAPRTLTRIFYSDGEAVSVLDVDKI